MSWHFVERWLQKVNQHSTLIGKFWLTFLIIFRIVVVSSVGDRVYSDEQSEFKCNTLQVCPILTVDPIFNNVNTNVPLKRWYLEFKSTQGLQLGVFPFSVHLNTDRADLNSLIFFKWLLVVPFLIYRIQIIGYNLFDIKYRLGFQSQKKG